MKLIIITFSIVAILISGCGDNKKTEPNESNKDPRKGEFKKSKEKSW